MNRVRELRKQQGRTIAELAMRLGVTESTLRNWERGRHLPKSASMRRKLARVLGVTEVALALDSTTPVNVSPEPHRAEPEKFPPLVAAIIRRADRVLLTQRRFPKLGEVWSWPSGRVAEGESFEDAVLRHLHHELVIDAPQVIGRLGDIDLDAGYRMTHFRVTIPDHVEPAVKDHEELVQVKWMTRDEAEEAFRTLNSAIAQSALSLIDAVLASDARGHGARSESENGAR